MAIRFDGDLLKQSERFLRAFVQEPQIHKCGRQMLLLIFPDDRPGLIADGKAGSAWWCPECAEWFHFYLSSHIAVVGKPGSGALREANVVAPSTNKPKIGDLIGSSEPLSLPDGGYEIHHSYHCACTIAEPPAKSRTTSGGSCAKCGFPAYGKTIMKGKQGAAGS